MSQYSMIHHGEHSDVRMLIKKNEVLSLLVIFSLRMRITEIPSLISHLL